MLTLYQTPPAWGMSTFSPFCLKVDIFLRMIGVPFTCRTADLRKAPKGKVPWIVDGEAMVADSTDIIRYIEQKCGASLDDRLTAAQRVQALLLQRTMEEHTYFALAHLRWSSAEAWPYLKDALALPGLLRGLVAPALRRRMLKATYAQGIGRHTRGQILDRLKRDLDAYSATLGQSRYFMGDAPTTIDATMFGFLSQIIRVPWESPEKDYLRGITNLGWYCDRLRERYFDMPTRPA